MTNTTRILIIATLFFMAALYLVEASPIGSKAVAKYNGGFGTFDMKKYDAILVKDILSKTEDKGFRVYKLYYLADTIFILAFGFFQIVVLQFVFSWVKQPYIVLLLCLIPVMRGLADAVENVILCMTLFQYPVVHDKWIAVSSIATSIKFWMIKIWVCEMLTGAIARIVIRIRT